MPQSRAVDALRALCRHATPLVARAREMEALRALVAGLATLVHEGARQEERLRETQGELQTARSMQALRAHLIGSVNHALRTPLVALRGYTRLLRRGRDGQWTADEVQYLDVIARNVERMIEVARNLWLPQRTMLDLAPLDLREVWRQAHERTAERAGRITAHVPDAPVRLLGDPDALAHMLAELAVQRLDRLPPDSGLLVTIAGGTHAATVTLSTGPSGDGRPVAEDEDNGRWFDPLREIANLHGGQIVTGREPGQGLAFVVTLPRLAGSDSGEI
jgi:signal transduction histidine kinase